MAIGLPNACDLNHGSAVSNHGETLRRVIRLVTIMTHICYLHSGFRTGQLVVKCTLHAITHRHYMMVTQVRTMSLGSQCYLTQPWELKRMHVRNVQSKDCWNSTAL